MHHGIKITSLFSKLTTHEKITLKSNSSDQSTIYEKKIVKASLSTDKDLRLLPKPPRFFIP